MRDEKQYKKVVVLDFDGVINTFKPVSCDLEATHNTQAQTWWCILISNPNTLDFLFNFLHKQGVLIVPGSQRITYNDQDAGEKRTDDQRAEDGDAVKQLKDPMYASFDDCFGKERPFLVEADGDVVAKEYSQNDRNKNQFLFNVEKAFETYGIEKKDIILVDDGEKYVDPARESGYQAIRVERKDDKSDIHSPSDLAFLAELVVKCDIDYVDLLQALKSADLGETNKSSEGMKISHSSDYMKASFLLAYYYATFMSSEDIESFPNSDDTKLFEINQKIEKSLKKVDDKQRLKLLLDHHTLLLNKEGQAHAHEYKCVGEKIQDLLMIAVKKEYLPILKPYFTDILGNDVYKEKGGWLETPKARKCLAAYFDKSREDDRYNIGDDKKITEIIRDRLQGYAEDWLKQEQFTDYKCQFGDWEVVDAGLKAELTLTKKESGSQEIKFTVLVSQPHYVLDVESDIEVQLTPANDSAYDLMKRNEDVTRVESELKSLTEALQEVYQACLKAPLTEGEQENKALLQQIKPKIDAFFKQYEQLMQALDETDFLEDDELHQKMDEYIKLLEGKNTTGRYDPTWTMMEKLRQIHNVSRNNIIDEMFKGFAGDFKVQEDLKEERIKIIESLSLESKQKLTDVIRIYHIIYKYTTLKALLSVASKPNEGAVNNAGFLYGPICDFLKEEDKKDKKYLQPNTETPRKNTVWKSVLSIKETARSNKKTRNKKRCQYGFAFAVALVVGVACFVGIPPLGIAALAGTSFWVTLSAGAAAAAGLVGGARKQGSEKTVLTKLKRKKINTHRRKSLHKEVDIISASTPAQKARVFSQRMKNDSINKTIFYKGMGGTQCFALPKQKAEWRQVRYTTFLNNPDPGESTSFCFSPRQLSRFVVRIESADTLIENPERFQELLIFIRYCISGDSDDRKISKEDKDCAIDLLKILNKDQCQKKIFKHYSADALNDKNNSVMLRVKSMLTDPPKVKVRKDLKDEFTKLSSAYSEAYRKQDEARMKENLKVEAQPPKEQNPKKIDLMAEKARDEALKRLYDKAEQCATRDAKEDECSQNSIYDYAVLTLLSGDTKNLVALSTLLVLHESKNPIRAAAKKISTLRFTEGEKTGIQDEVTRKTLSAIHDTIRRICDQDKEGSRKSNMKGSEETRTTPTPTPTPILI